jgi:phage shock protein PspC (stress-responsive transcriptional regulator)
MKKLYRIKEGAVIGGVCGGVADYLGIDRSIVRILAAVAFIFTGFITVGIIYLICMGVLPYDDGIING